METLARARLALIGAAALFSTGGAVIKSIDLTAWQVASFRSGIAALVIYACMPEARRLTAAGPWRVGVAFAATLLLFVAANKLTTSANAIFLQSSAPLYLVLLAPLLLSEPIARRDLLFLAAMAVGLLLFFVGETRGSASAPNPSLGNVLGACSGLTWAFVILGLRALQRSGGGGAGPAAVVAGNVLACAAGLAFALPVARLRAQDAAWIVFLGAIQIGLAYALLTRGMRKVRALEASLLLLIEPVLNPVWSYLVHGEVPGAFALLGCSVILAATVIRSAADSRLN